MNYYNKGYNQAINDIINFANEQISHYEKLDEKSKRSKKFSHRADVLLDFRIYVESLFKTEVILSYTALDPI